jgi:hypothetical protein
MSSWIVCMAHAVLLFLWLFLAAARRHLLLNRDRKLCKYESREITPGALQAIRRWDWAAERHAQITLCASSSISGFRRPCSGQSPGIALPSRGSFLCAPLVETRPLPRPAVADPARQLGLVCLMSDVLRTLRRS